MLLGRKLLITGSAGVLSLGLIGVPAASFADDGGTQAQPTVTQSGGSFVVTLPGVGTLSFSVDPTTNALTGLMVTPADPSVTAGTPVLTDEGVQVLFTTPTGNETLEVEVEGDGATVVKAEVEGPDDVAENAGTATGHDDGDNENGAQPGEDQNENQAEPGEDQGTTTPTTTQTMEGSDHSGDGSGDGRAPGTTTTTVAPTPMTTMSSGTDGGSDGGSHDGSTSQGGDGGSGSSGDGNSADG